MLDIRLFRCFLSCIYIKPQLHKRLVVFILVVSYLVSTSNHNYASILDMSYELFLILYLHQTTTRIETSRSRLGLFLILYLHQTTT